MPTSEKRRSRRRTRNLFVKAVKNALKIPERLTVSEWAEKYRILDSSSNFKGRWSNEITPYLIGIMDALNDPYIQEINFCKPTQVGGTEAMLNMLGWIISDDPAPAMVVYPTDDLAKDTVRDRLKPSLLKTEEIKGRYLERASNELNLKFRGMTIYFRSAGSPSKLASKSIKYLFFDEIDKIGGATKKEASPYNLAKERTRTFTYSKKIYTCSTPTLKTNYVWQLHEKADVQRIFTVPCPHCGEMIDLKWKQIQFPSGEGMTNDERAKGAVYVCQECGCEITDKQKIQILRKGKWKDENKKCVGKPQSVSFWLNALYSRFLTWADIVKEFLTSKDDPEKLQNFVNSWLAEPWEDTKLKTTEDTVMERQTELEEFVVPDYAKLLTGGVDVQENCMYWTIRAFGNYLTSQNIAHGQALSWREIEDAMNAVYKKADGTQMIVELALVDSGNDTDNVYDFCVNNSDWAIPVKGSSHEMATYYKISKIDKEGSKAYGMQLVVVDTDKYKDMVAGRMRRQNGRGAWMVYRGCDQEYAKQVTAEHKVSVRKNGKMTQKWVPKRSHADNHYLDAEVYAMAAGDIRGIRYMHLQQEEPKTEKQTESPEENWINANERWL